LTLLEALLAPFGYPTGGHAATHEPRGPGCSLFSSQFCFK